MMEFNWDIHYKCNYRCPYCPFYGKWQEVSQASRYFSVEEWISAWRRVYKKYGTVRIIMAGGEPIIYPSSFALIKELSRMHQLDVVTNLSCSKEVLSDLIGQLDDSHKLSLSASYQPLFTSFELFLEKILIIKEKGILAGINIVAYPPALKLLGYFKDEFKKNGFNIVILPFRGEYGGVIYPYGYTAEEASMIYDLAADFPIKQQEQLEQFMHPNKSKGKLCYAGQKYVHIGCDAQVYRCNTGEQRIGYFFDEKLTFLEHPLVCEQEVCPCEFRWLVKDN